MPIVDIRQDVSWPGVLGVESLSGTISHGITPSVFTLVCYPQTSLPATFGDLTFGDGEQTVTLTDCKLDSISGSAGSAGQSYQLTILDRRWKWKTGAVSGRYNQLDRRGKLIPWTIKSPTELAELCFEEMGERNFLIDLPQGVNGAQVINFENFLRAGRNFPQSFANPPTVWDKTPPAVALAALADRYGCRVVYQHIQNRVLIVPLGEGRVILPDLPCEVTAPALDDPETPVAVAVAGAPVRIQMRLALEAVGEEWDGSILPVNDLSYAPPGGAGATQESEIQWTNGPPGTNGFSLKVWITYNPDWRSPNPDPAKNKRLFCGAGGPDPILDKANVIALQILGLDFALGQLIRTEVAEFTAPDGSVGAYIRIKGRVAGFPFGVEAEGDGGPPPDRVRVKMNRAPALPRPNWQSCPPPTLAGVVPTDRLTYDQALALARKSVFKWYRVKFIDVSTGVAPIKVPWYGPLLRRQQLILEQTKVEQVEPAPRKFGGVQQNPEVPAGLRGQVGGILPEFYNGYSRDQKAVVYGSVAKLIGSVTWDGSKERNTEAEDEVYVEFDTDPVEQVVRFSDFLYRELPLADSLERVEFPALTLETSVLVCHPFTNEVIRWHESQVLGGAAPAEWGVREDVQVGVVAKYGANNKYKRFEFQDLKDAQARAQHYLKGMAKKYQLSGGETRQYIGIVRLELDGAVQQISYSFGGAGCSTTVSTNSEHSPFILDYPARRRAENLPPDKAHAAANMAEVAGMLAKIPKAP